MLKLGISSSSARKGIHIDLKCTKMFKAEAYIFLPRYISNRKAKYRK